MNVISELYDADNTMYANAHVTHQWANPNSGAYYQSFQTSGKGTIDQSIFIFQRMKDVYSFGNTISIPYMDNTGFHIFKSRNSFSKNNNCVAFPYVGRYGTQTSNMRYSTPFVENCMYSPGLAHLQYNSDEFRFFLDFGYNRLVLNAIVSAWFADGTEMRLVDLKDVIEGEAVHGTAHITYLNAEPCYQYGNNPQSRISGANDIAYNFLQFAGTVSAFSHTSGSYDRTYDYVVTSTKTGVFLSNWRTVLWQDCIHYTNENKVYGICDNVVCYDIEALYHDFPKPGEPNAVYVCLYVNQAIAIMDRLGFNWADNLNSAMTSDIGARCTDPHIRCPVIDPEGNKITDTVYSGTEIQNFALDNPDSNYNWDVGAIDYNGPSMIEIRANAEPEQVTIDPVDEIDLTEPVLATTGGTTMWLMTQQKLDELFTFLWDPNGTRFDDIVKGTALCGENPMDSVISLRFYPLNLQQLVTYSQHKLMFGRYNTGLSHFYVTSSNVIVLDLGGFTFNDAITYNDFRDYEPYTKYSIYIPFCGVIPLSAYECINTVLSLKMIIDLNTGACTSVVYTNGVPYKYIDGMIGIEIPVTGRDMSGYAQTVLGAALGGGIGGVATGNKAYNRATAPARGRLAANSALNSLTGNTTDSAMIPSLARDAVTASTPMPVALGVGFAVGGAAIAGTVAAFTNAPAVESAGSNAPAMGLAKPLYPYFIVQRSDCWIPVHYEKLYGRPCNIGGVVSDFVGYSEFGNVKIENITNATSEEKTLISNLLASGVYI